MLTTSEPRRPADRRARLAVTLLAAGAALLAAVPLSGAVAAADGPTLVLSRSAGLDPDGETLTVTGTGYDPAANVGARPPLAGQQSGVYVVFGRFAETWQPSQSAPTSARQIITQVWAVPQAAYDVLNPTGTNDEIVLLAPDGSFTAQVDAVPADGTGDHGVATYPGSGAVNAAQEILVPVTFGSATTTTTSTPSSSTPSSSTPPSSTPATSTTSTTVAPTTAPPTTAAPTTTPPPTTAPTVTTAGTGSRSAEGSAGQRLTVRPADQLDPDGASVTVSGSGYDPAVGIYLALCVDQGPTAAPSPCVGGVDMEGEGSSSAWISSNPPSYAGDLASPFGPGGSFEVSLTVLSSDEFVDCLDASTRCVMATRADHTVSSNRTADVRVPVYFEGQTPPASEPTEQPPTLSLGTSTIAAGGTIELTAAGFLAGEQVQIWMLSEPTLLAVALADGAGALTQTVTVPATVPLGIHHIELRGLTSGRVVRSGPVTLLASAAVTPAALTPTDVSNAGSSPAGGPTPGARLALTGSELTLVTPALFAMALGSLLLFGTRRRPTPGITPADPSDHRPGATR